MLYSYIVQATQAAMANAILPVQMLHAAAQFTSPDPVKQVLTGILVRPADDGGVIISSSDGHRAFRVTCPNPKWVCQQALLLSGKAFKKRIPYARIAEFETPFSNAAIHGGKKLTEYMQSLPAMRQCEYVAAADTYTSVNPATLYPDSDRIWPSQYGRETDTPIGFNAAYLADFLTIVKLYSHTDLVVSERNRYNTPMIFSAKVDMPELSVTMEYLLMPVEDQANRAPYASRGMVVTAESEE
jgi:hypothetical protein